MMEKVKCKKCLGSLKHSPDKIVICNFHEGPVHYGCCTHDCSMDGMPCMHATSVYEKLDM